MTLTFLKKRQYKEFKIELQQAAQVSIERGITQPHTDLIVRGTKIYAYRRVSHKL